MISKGQAKQVRQLQAKKFRDKFGLFLAEGGKIVEELLHSQLNVDKLFATRSWLDKGQAPAEKIVEVTADELRQISTLKHPKDVLGVFHQPELQPFSREPDEWILVLEDLQDPGNLGTMLRTADWFGIHQVVCSPRSVEVWNPKVVQATMGSIARVQVHYHEPLELLQQWPQVPSYAALLRGQPLQTIEPQPGFLLIGNEGAGLSKALVQQASQHITISRYGQAESLNAAIATGVLLHWAKTSSILHK